MALISINIIIPKWNETESNLFIAVHSMICDVKYVEGICERWTVPKSHTHTQIPSAHIEPHRNVHKYTYAKRSLCITCVRITFWLTWCVTTSVYDINKRTNEMYLVFSSIDGPTSWYDNGVKEKYEKKSNQDSVKSQFCTIYAWRNLWTKYHKILQCLREQQTDVGWKIS